MSLTRNSKLYSGTRKFKAKQPWNSFLTDISHFSLTKEEVLARKNRLVSKNNIFLNHEFELSQKKIKAKRGSQSIRSLCSETALDIMDDNSDAGSDRNNSPPPKSRVNVNLFPSESSTSSSEALSDDEVEESKPISSKSKNMSAVTPKNYVHKNYNSRFSTPNEAKEKKRTNRYISPKLRQMQSSQGMRVCVPSKYRRSKYSSTNTPANLSSGSFVFSPSNTQTPPAFTTSTRFDQHGLVKEEEYDEVYALIRSLTAELRHYEMLTGYDASTSPFAFSSEELETVMIGT